MSNPSSPERGDFVAVLRYKIAWWRWFLGDEFHKVAGQPWLGCSRAERNANLRMISDRWLAREPKDPRRA